MLPNIHVTSHIASTCLTPPRNVCAKLVYVQCILLNCHFVSINTVNLCYCADIQEQYGYNTMKLICSLNVYEGFKESVFPWYTSEYTYKLTHNRHARVLIFLVCKTACFHIQAFFLLKSLAVQECSLLSRSIIFTKRHGLQTLSGFII